MSNNDSESRISRHSIMSKSRVKFFEEVKIHNFSNDQH